VRASSRVLALSLGLATTTSCALEHRAAARFVDPELREGGIAYTSRQRARVISAGPWEVRRVPASALAAPKSVPSADFDTDGQGRATHEERYVFQIFVDGASAPVATTSCVSARRQGPEAALASAAELPSDDVSLACVTESREARLTLTVRGRLDRNLRGEWSAQPRGSGLLQPAAEGTKGVIEVLLHHQIWGRVPARTPATIIQIFREDDGDDSHTDSDTPHHSMRAVAAANLDRRGSLWMSPSLGPQQAVGAVSILGAHIFAPFGWEQAS
jgi:hypothetical protein